MVCSDLGGTLGKGSGLLQNIRRGRILPEAQLSYKLRSSIVWFRNFGFVFGYWMQRVDGWTDSEAGYVFYFIGRFLDYSFSFGQVHCYEIILAPRILCYAPV